MLIGTGNVRGRKRRREKEMWRQHYIRTVSSLDLILMCLGRELVCVLACSGTLILVSDFAGVWPIFDAAQSRDFRKVVQGLINELESQGALPRSNSRVSSLATCCGQRFVELLWHLSAHALREVHRRTFPADVASNPLPASLTELVCPNTRPVSLLAVTKARIALERKRFMKGATQAVERQTSWSNLAHDMTAEYRALCAEEAFQHQELEKLQESSYPNVSDDSAVSDTEGFVTSISAGPVIRASQLWKGILSHSERVAELASGPIEDLIARREHRYRIDGAVLRAAVDLGSVNLPVESSSCSTADYDSQRPRFEVGVSTEDDKSTKTPPPVDVGEILRRWTHALQTVHKQTLRLARSNNGAGPELMMESTHGEESVHVHSLRTTLGEHKQHFSSLRSLKNQLEASMPGMEAAITTLRERVDGPDTMAASRAAQNALIVTSKTSHWVATSREEDLEQSALEFINNSAMPLELTPPSPALKLPYTSPSANGVSTFSKAASGISSMPSLDVLQEQEGLESNGIVWNGGCEITEGISSLRQAVIEAALQKPNSVVRDITQQPTNTEHYFTPVSPFQMHAKSSREIVSVVTDTNQPPTYIGKDDVPTFIPSENRDRTVEEKNGYVADPQNFVRRGVSPMSRKGLNGRQHVERSSWKSPHDLPQRTSELHVHDFQPLSPSLFLDCNSFDRTFDGTYDNLLAPMTDLDSAFMSIGDRRETRAI